VTAAGIAPIADARAPVTARRVRGLSPADAIAVVCIAALTGAFIDPRWPSGVMLIVGVGAIYAIFRTTRGLPMRRRALAMVAAFVLPLALAVVLESRA
jgi:hypothetical protein